MALEFQPIEIDHDGDHEGRLVLRDGKLLAILSRLSAAHNENAGRWFIECGFGALIRREEHFADLDAVAAWINEQVA